MTIAEAMTRVDELMPSAYEAAEKVRWLSALEGRIRHEVIDGHEGAPEEPYVPLDPDGSLDVELMVKEPYTDVYIEWLCTQICYRDGEMARYNNCMVMFNVAFSAFAAWYNRTHMPRQDNCLRTTISRRGK